MSAPLVRATRAELSKLARQPATRVLALVLVAYLALVVVAFYSILRAPDVEGFDKEPLLAPLRADAVGYTLALFAGTSTIVLVVFGALLIGQEMSRATVRTVLLAGIPRAAFVGAKAATVALVALPLAALGVLFAAGGAALFGQAIGEDLLRIDALGLAWSFVGIAVVLAGWGVLALALTLWTGSLGAGIGSTAGLLIVGDVMGDLLGGLGTAGLYASRLLPAAGFDAFMSTAPPPGSTWLWALPNLVAWLGLLPWLAARRFQRADALALTR